MATSQGHADIEIFHMHDNDWECVRKIYIEGIQAGHATFETSVPSWQKWDSAHLKSPRLVAKSGPIIAGWAALSTVSDRCVYGGVAEVSVYVAADFAGRGIGSDLLKHLITHSEELGIWTLQAGIFPENKSSLALHKKCGFRQVGIREKLGQLHGIWRDVILLERRSDRIGI